MRCADDARRGDQTLQVTAATPRSKPLMKNSNIIIAGHARFRRMCLSSLDHKRTRMTSHLTSRFTWRIGLFGFSILALFSFAAALFFFISDDFVIRGQVVPASDARFVPWRVGLSLAGVFSVFLAWLCYRQNRRPLKV